jgi:hypothetical protein
MIPNSNKITYSKKKRKKKGQNRISQKSLGYNSYKSQDEYKLGVPIPSPVTLVSMLRFPNVINWNFGPENKGIYIEILTIS